jgi:uncharacterized membrane protein YidH (DUF202 family)
LSDSGLQAERTSLSWTRTSLGFLANGALVALPDFGGETGLFKWVAAVLAAALALSTYLIGRRRQRALARLPLPARISPRREVYLLGISVLLLIVISALSLVI